jgi:predicted AAA+ superfamily ATPase
MNETTFIYRHIYHKIKENIFQGKVILIYGARQIGKTTLLKHLRGEYENVMFLNGDEPSVQENFSSRKNSNEIKQFIGDSKLVFIDEAQNIEGCAKSIKLIYDTYSEIQIIATGSSAFDLQNMMNEPLTGRNLSLYMNPLMLSEFQTTLDHKSDIYRYTDDMLIWGMYPEVRLLSGEKRKERLLQLTNDYLLKDILTFESIRKPALVQNILKILADQVGSTFSINSISNDLNVSRNTVEKYIQILEQAYIIFRLPAYSSKERVKARMLDKIYFWDNGIRNGILGRLTDMDIREDKGALFENFIISEKMKMKRLFSNDINYYFWREKNDQEIDIIEEDDVKKIKGYECKYNVDNVKTPIKAPVEKVEVVNSKNYSEFLAD